MKAISILSHWVFLLTLMSLSGCSGSSSDSNNPPADTVIPWIDTHAHSQGYDTECTTQDCLDAIIATMDEYGVKKTIFIHPPAPGYDPDSEAAIRTVVAYDSSRFLYGAGGNVLNSLIQRTAPDGTVPSQLNTDFDNAMSDIVTTGGFVCYGEITALHLSYAEAHAYEETRADTPLFLSLADYAAANNVPIDLHMDVVSEDMTTPSYFTDRSPNNPAEIEENISALETLLAYNRNAKIVFAHAGRDTTGQHTASLIEQLLRDHPNFYIQIHPVFGPLFTENAIVDQAGNIRSEWLSLLQNYPDRAVLGSDHFYEGTSDDGINIGRVQTFLQNLPGSLATSIGCTNPVSLYNLTSGCE